MKASGDRVIGRSGDWKSEFTTEALKRGEEQLRNLTTEARRHGESNFQDFGMQLYIRDSGSCCFSDHPVTRDHPITGSARRSYDIFEVFYERIQNALRTFLAVLREIFDESAYDRFLLRTQRQRSVESYRAFMIERDAVAATKPRCC